VDADDLEPFRRQIDESTVLVIDDLHSMADKSAAQEELAVRISARLDLGRPTVLTCRRLPSDVRGMRPSLVSRSLPGLTVPVRLPSASTRRLILRELALAMSLDVDDDLLDLLSLGFSDEISVRQMLASIKQLTLWCRMNDSPVNTQAIQSVLDQLCEDRSVSITEITQRVARHFRLRSSDLRSDSRRQNVVRARSLAMMLARKITSLSLNQIGAEFGGRDHTTVLHAIRKTESLLETDADLRRAAQDLTEKLT
jgi:chromosomal replication initiator protein